MAWRVSERSVSVNGVMANAEVVTISAVARANVWMRSRQRMDGPSRVGRLASAVAQRFARVASGHVDAPGAAQDGSETRRRVVGGAAEHRFDGDAAGEQRGCNIDHPSVVER